MTDISTIVRLLTLWLLCLALALWGQRNAGKGAGLVVSYVLQLWVLHWLAASIYAFPWYKAPAPAMVLGLQQSVYAIAGFAFGSTAILAAIDFLRDHISSRSFVTYLREHPVDPRLVQLCLAAGVVTYFFLEPVLHDIPTVSAIAAASSNLLLVAIAMACWNGVQQDRRGAGIWPWLAAAAALPFITIVTKGFLGYGFASMLTVFSFLASVYRPRWKLVVGSIAVGYLALSLYVTYMRDRREIREVVWGGEAYASRVSAFSRTLNEFELLDIQNYDHLSRIDERLNQNFLVGRAVEYLNAHPERFSNGRTLREAFLSLVPRTFWPEKPMVAGSGDLVSEFTGLRFDKKTSVGIGHVMEWYVNFGTTGVIFGMALIGAIVGLLDRAAAARLYRGDGVGFVLYWLPGLSLLQVGGSLVEAVSSAGAGLVIGSIVFWLSRSRSRSRLAFDDSPDHVLPAASLDQR